MFFNLHDRILPHIEIQREFREIYRRQTRQFTDDERDLPAAVLYKRVPCHQPASAVLLFNATSNMLLQMVFMAPLSRKPFLYIISEN